MLGLEIVRLLGSSSDGRAAFQDVRVSGAPFEALRASGSVLALVGGHVRERRNGSGGDDEIRPRLQGGKEVGGRGEGARSQGKERGQKSMMVCLCTEWTRGSDFYTSQIR